MAIEDAAGRIDYDECGSGPAIVLVPGSCSTGAAWRPVIAHWDSRFRCITTSLPGYGRTAERRDADNAIAHVAEAVEAVVQRAGAPVHLVGHSFGGLVSVAVASRRRVALSSLTIIEAPAVELLRTMKETAHEQSFRTMTEAYFAAFRKREPGAIAAMVDFYGGPGTFASWPERVRAYAEETTAVNIRDWASAFGFPLLPGMLAGIGTPALVLRGGEGHPAVKRANELLSRSLGQSTLETVEGAAHFMIATHAREVAALIATHIEGVERGSANLMRRTGSA